MTPQVTDKPFQYYFTFDQNKKKIGRIQKYPGANERLDNGTGLGAPSLCRDGTYPRILEADILTETFYISHKVGHSIIKLIWLPLFAKTVRFLHKMAIALLRQDHIFFNKDKFSFGKCAQASQRRKAFIVNISQITCPHFFGFFLAFYPTCYI